MFPISMQVVPPFDDQVYRSIAENIQGDKFDRDDTMLATLRALLFERLGGQVFKYHFRGMQSEEIAGETDKMFESIFHYADPYTLNVTNILGDETVVKEAFYKLSKTEGWTNKEDIKAYFETIGNTQLIVLVDEENVRACIAVYKLRMSIYHHLQGFIRRYLPALFKDQNYTEEETRLAQSFSKTSSSDYARIIKEIVTKQYKPHVLRFRTIDIYRRAREAEIERAKSKIEEQKARVENYSADLIRAHKEHQQALTYLQGLLTRQKTDKNSEELYEFLCHNPNIEVIRTEENEMDIIIRTTLDFFDADIAEEYIDNGVILEYGSYVDGFEDEDDRRLLLENIFSNKANLKIKMCAFYRLNLLGNVSVRAGYNYPPEYNDCLPNPHLQEHACLGSYAQYINTKLKDGDVIGAIEQCLASASSVNVDETDLTFKPMLEWLYESDEEILINEDGRSMTPIEALNWLKN